MKYSSETHYKLAVALTKKAESAQPEELSKLLNLANLHLALAAAAEKVDHKSSYYSYKMEPLNFRDTDNYE